ncbi:hypothetical protein ASG90_04800 [Nocardioides sp. Soil797]|nr:hypothetical protein ASG90_04800 [Nocardioides sp. Soil797]
MRRAAIAMVGFLLAMTVLPAVAAQDDRSTTMPEQMRQTGVYLEASPAQGNPALWRKRLETGVRKADVGAPVHVALWTEADDLWPNPEWFYDHDDAALLRKLRLPEHSIALLASEPGFVRVEQGLKGRAADRVRAWKTRGDAVIRRIESASPDRERYPTMTAVAQVWVMLRLAAGDAPAPQDLVSELSGDVTLLDDQAVAPQAAHDDGAEAYSSPWAFVMVGVVLLLTVGVFLRITWVSRRGSLAERVAAPTRRGPDPLLATLTPLAVEQEVTDLAERISASDVRPGDAAYDAAQACLDAAAKYVDSDRERDMVGVHLLVADGRSALERAAVPSRCFFHPSHTATTAVHRRKVSLPCCAQCAGAVTAGQVPPSLVVTGDDGVVRAYFDTDDVWTSTGYGAIDERWARRALLAALEAR